ncbi:MAG: DUF3368 domain-containing protein [Cyanobacteria bacterium P01_D01_bin.105]
MLINQVVINASPLIVLFKSSQADLLPQLFETIIVPQAVYDEVTAIKSDAAANQLPTVSWINRTHVDIHPAIAAWDLGIGESAVLSFALANPGHRAMVDDSAARRCARSLRISTLGTGGALVLAKRRKLIPSIVKPLQTVQDAGLWLSTDVVSLLKQQAGE